MSATGSIPPPPPVWLFDAFEPGRVIGHHEDRIDTAAAAAWQAIYGGALPGAEGRPLPSGLATVLVMRAYLAVVSPRPPGNIHRLLTVRRLAPLRLDEALRTTVRCVGRSRQGDRRVLRFQADCQSLEPGAPMLVSGELELLWAA